MPPTPTPRAEAPSSSPRRRRLRASAPLAAFLALRLAAPAAADEEAERALLRRSWAEACGHYDERTNWTARQACNLAWFRAHEKGVWQHNLNPHGPPAPEPSS